jgi:hypothetical protein
MNTVLPPGQGAFAAALLDPDLPCPPGLRAWNGSEPARRFAVHRNNVVASLVDALADTFPVVQRLVGREFFRAMAALFVRRHPPDSPLLHRYGGGLPDFIAAFAAARALPYLADVARLEFARVQACHAADAAPLAPAATTSALSCGERAGELRLRLHPSLRCLASPFAIVSLWAAHQQEDEPGAIDVSQAECAIVVRPAFEVLVLRCDAATAAFLAVEGGLGERAAAAAAVPGFDLGATLGLLIAHGAVTGLVLPEEDLA